MLNTQSQKPQKIKLFWGLLFTIIWLGTNIFVVTQTPEWTEKYITAFILGNICMFVAAAYMFFVYKTAKKIEQFEEVKIKYFYKISMWILGITLLILPFFFIIHVPDSAHNWDFFEIFVNTSKLQGQNFTHLPMTEDERLYFLRYPNNQFFGIVYNTLFAPFSMTAKIWATTAVAAVLTVISVLAGSLIVKKIASTKRALLYNIVAFGFLPFYLYGAQLYTDTASLPFVIVGLLFIIYAIKSEKLSQQIIWWSLALLLIFLGYTIKPTVMIPLIAVLIFLVWNKKWRQLMIMIPLSLVLFTGVNIGVKAVIASDPAFTKETNDRYNLPMSHWIAMSFYPENKYGGFNPKVLAYSESFPNKEAKNEADKKLIVENFKRLGFVGTLQQLGRKIAYTWFNGDLSNFFYTYRHQNPFIFRYFDWTSFNPPEGNITGWLLIKAAQTLYWLALAPLMFYEIFLSIFKKHRKEWFVLGLSMAGLTGFLLIWEANSRYLYNFAPIMIALATMGLVDLLNRKVSKKHEISE